MCGIVGYVGPQDARDVVLEGLRRLEYRGYDSAGVAVLADGGLSSAKKAGKLANLEKVLAERPLPGGHHRDRAHPVGHARRADRPQRAPAPVRGRRGRRHPQRDHRELRRAARRVRGGGRRVPLRDRHRGRRAPARRRVRRRARGPGPARRGHARGVPPARGGLHPASPPHADEPDVVVGARRNRPLVVGVGDGEYFLGSDVAAFIAHTREARELGQDQVVELDRGRGSPSPTSPAPPSSARPTPSTGTPRPPRRAATTGSCSRRSPSSPRRSPTRCSAGSARSGQLALDEVRLSDQELRDIDKIFVVACGTAFHAGLIAKYAIEHWTRIPVEVELASEFRYRDPVLDRSTLVIAISQSGETMDTLMALRHAREQNARVLAICNTNGSTIPRESDAVLYTHAGPEVAVASTKGFLTQIVACYLVGLFLAQVRGMKYEDEVVGHRRRPAPAARGGRRGAGGHGAGARAGPLAGRREHGAVPRPARRVPGGAGGGAEAQGARLHPRRGLRGRRAQARPDRRRSTRGRR